MAGGARRDRRSYYRDWAGRNPDRVIALNRVKQLRLYGLTEADYARLVEDQDGRCAICQTDDPGSSKYGNWSVDHDHVAEDIGVMHVRGLLCTDCNLMIGRSREDPDRLRAAADYLERTNMLSTDKVVTL